MFDPERIHPAMKRIRLLAVILVLCTLTALLPTGAAAASVTLYVDEDGTAAYPPKQITPVAILCNGEVLESDIPAYVTNGRTMVPVRLIAETLGATVEWISATRQVRITLGGREILLTIGSAVALVDGEETELYNGIPAVIAHDGVTKRTMVPLRFVAEQLGASAEWDSSLKAAVITPAYARVSALTQEEGLFTIAFDGVCTPSVFTLSNPKRLVVDFPGGVLTESVARRTEVGGALVAKIRTNQYDHGYEGYEKVARIVFDLAEGVELSELKASVGYGCVVVHPAAITPVLSEPPAAPVLPDEEPVTPEEMPEVPEEEPETPEEAPETPEEEPESPEQPEQTPEQPDAEPAPQRTIVVLDAGHGGSDPGTQAAGLDEKDLNLDVTMMTGAILELAGVGVCYTRTEDVYVTLADRVALANDLPATLFVSIHTNASATSTTLHGLETYYLAGKTESLPLATSLHASVLEATGAHDNSVRTGDYFLMRETKMPAALVEMGYVTNASDLAQLRLPEYRLKIAQGIAAGIVSYLTANGLL